MSDSDKAPLHPPSVTPPSSGYGQPPLNVAGGKRAGNVAATVETGLKSNIPHYASQQKTAKIHHSQPPMVGGTGGDGSARGIYGTMHRSAMGGTEMYGGEIYGRMTGRKSSFTASSGLHRPIPLRPPQGGHYQGRNNNNNHTDQSTDEDAPSEFNPASLGNRRQSAPQPKYSMSSVGSGGFVRRGSCCSRMSLSDRRGGPMGPPSHHGSLQDLSMVIYEPPAALRQVAMVPMPYGPAMACGPPQYGPPGGQMAPFWYSSPPPPPPPPPPQLMPAEMFFGGHGQAQGMGMGPMGPNAPLDFETFRRMMKEAAKAQKKAKMVEAQPSPCAHFCCGGVAQLLWTIIAITCLGFVAALLMALYII